MSNQGKGSGFVLFVLGALVLAGGIGGYVFINKDQFFGPANPNVKEKKKKGDPSKWPSDKPLTNSPTLKLPFILWGGDVATFVANGGPATTNDSVFAKHGLSFDLVDGNDFNKQVDSYLKNETPFLRGTLSMLAQKCDVLGKDPKTQPVVFLQMTWSAGDHLVSRENMKTLSDIRGKRICLQKDGPHVGMLDDILRTADLQWSDIRVEWTTDVTGDKGPAALFRKDPTIDACFAITPDMMALTGGLEKSGDGKENTVACSHVLVSTADMKRSIADVYACRKDFYDANQPLIDRFVAGYLKGCEELLALRRKHRENPNTQYKAVLKMTQDLLTKEAVPTEDDAAGLVDDAVFVGLLGNKSFFDDAGNLSGFAPKTKYLLDFAVQQGYAKRRVELQKGDLNYDFIEHLGELTVKEPPTERFRNAKLLPNNTIYSFIVYFEPRQSVFPEKDYGTQFERALQQASLFGNAVMEVRGHGDPTFIPFCLVEGGKKKGIVTQDKGALMLPGGKKLDTSNILQVMEVVKAYPNLMSLDENSLLEIPGDPLYRQIEGLQQLSEERAESVRNAVMKFGSNKQISIDNSQFRALGAGGTEPVTCSHLMNGEQMAKNRRVEFRLVRLSADAKAEAIESDFDF